MSCEQCSVNFTVFKRKVSVCACVCVSEVCVHSELSQCCVNSAPTTSQVSEVFVQSQTLSCELCSVNFTGEEMWMCD